MQDSFLRPRLEQGKLNQSARISGPDAKLPNIICIPLYQHRQWPKASKPNFQNHGLVDAPSDFVQTKTLRCASYSTHASCRPACLGCCVRLRGFAPPVCLPSCLPCCLPHLVWNAVSAFLGLPSNNLVWDAVSASLGLYPGLSPVLSLNLSPILSSSWSGMLSPLACLRSYLQLVCDAGLCHCGATHCKKQILL